MHQTDLIQTRRHFFDECRLGIGKIALASLLTGATSETPASAAPRTQPAPTTSPHFKPQVRAVIQLFMEKKFQSSRSVRLQA